MIPLRLFSDWLLWVIATTTAVIASTSAFASVFPKQSYSPTGDVGVLRSQGSKPAVYYLIYDRKYPQSYSQLQEKKSRVRASEAYTQQFYAANSGGKFGIRYEYIVPVPIDMKADGSRPPDWRYQAKTYLTSLGLRADRFFAHVFDLSATPPEAGSAFSGIYLGDSDIAVQIALSDVNNGNELAQRTIDHELGHRLGTGHAGAWRTMTATGFQSYVWNQSTGNYLQFDSDSDSQQPMPYGVYFDEYGSPFDTMSNIGHGHFRVREKAFQLGWVPESTVGNLEQLGAGTYRIYAHDELQLAYRSHVGYGVEETYRSDVYYGLTFSRWGETFDSARGEFIPDLQTIDLEYRTGRDGVQFYLDGALVDLDAEGGNSRTNLERDLEVGKSLDDVDFGLSNYSVTASGNDFLSYSPPPPSDALSLRNEWWHFYVAGLGKNDVGSYVELTVSAARPLNGLAGDFNQDGAIDTLDIDLLLAGYLSDTTPLSELARYSLGDLNLDGKTNELDVIEFDPILETHGLRFPLERLPTVPEPVTLILVTTSLLLGGSRRTTSLIS